MKASVLILLAANCMFAEEPKLPDSLLKERWKALAIHHSNTIRQIQIQSDLAKSKAAYEKAMADIKAACGDAGYDDSGPEVICKAAAK